MYFFTQKPPSYVFDRVLDTSLRFRSSDSQEFFKISVLKNFAIFTGKQTFVLESLFDKVAGLKASNFIKKRLQHRRFPVNIAKF